MEQTDAEPLHELIPKGYHANVWPARYATGIWYWGCYRDCPGETEDYCVDADYAATQEEAYLLASQAALADIQERVKGEVTKLKKRIANGVCPCCKRSFCNLAAHMKTQHPEYTKEEE